MDYNGLVELASSSTDSAALGLGTFSLKDNRDQKSYNIRRLADGKCWMVQSLALDLSDFEGTTLLTSDNTELVSKGTWDPLVGADLDSVPQYSVINDLGYYNWYAATAGSGKASDGYRINVSDSICPAKWTILNSSLGYSTLLRKYFPDIVNGTDTYYDLAISIPIEISENQGITSDFSSVSTSRILAAYHWGKSGYTASVAYSTRTIIQTSKAIAYDNGFGDVTEGYSVRCVNKGSNQETVVSTCAANSICYNSNGGSGSVETQTVEASETTATLASASALSRDGYVFAGWSTAPSGYGDIFGQNTETTVGDLTTSGLQLYAKWVKPELTMQGFTSARCSIMEENQKISLIDTRDSKIYGAIKLGDGECWMADDLAYTGSDGSYVTEYNDKIYYRANRFASKNPCPGGWSVPTKTQADAMLPYYENLSLSAVGGYYHGSIHNYEAAAFYWTSTPQTGGTLWYSISVRQTNVPIVSPGYGSDAGMFVRCIAQ